MKLASFFRSPEIGAETERAARRAPLARRLYRPRIVGLAMGGLCVAAVLREADVDWPVWVALALNALAWPHLALIRAQRSADPHRAEIVNLMIDSLLGGMWLPVMAFNLLPSVVLLTMLSMDNISVGGVRLLLKGLVAQLIGVGVAVAVVGLDFRPASSLAVMIACVPMLVLYPMIIGLIAYDLASRLRRQNQQLEKMSRTDGLTGLINRSHWEAIVTREYERFQRTAEPVSLLMVDVDHFKEINDRHGHPVGDRVLKTVARLLDEGRRQIDAVGRYGGEEFGIILPGTDSRGAQVIAERLRHRFDTTVLTEGYGTRLTVSIGIAELTRDTPSYSQWIAMADQALYQAKQAGRNRVEVWVARV